MALLRAPARARRGPLLGALPRDGRRARGARLGRDRASLRGVPAWRGLCHRRHGEPRAPPAQRSSARARAAARGARQGDSRSLSTERPGLARADLTTGGEGMSKVALVTGANQGLGLALVRRLCRTLGDDGIVYLTARDAQRGERAVKELRAEGLSPRFCRLDVTDDESVTSAARDLAREHGGVDVVISNAAARISPEVPASRQVAMFVDTNNHGTHRMLKAFVPLLRDGARFVVVAS